MSEIARKISGITYSIDCETIGYTTRDKWNLTFEDDEILVEEVGVTGTYSYGGKK